MGELEALLQIEAERLNEQSSRSDASPSGVDQAGGKSGRFSPEIIARSPASAPSGVSGFGASAFPPSRRAAVCGEVLEAIREGYSLRAAAAGYGLSYQTLLSWIITHDEPAYREALAAQVGKRLTFYASSAAAADHSAAVAEEKLMAGERIVIEEGEHGTRYALAGVELAKVARVRAQVALDGAKHWQFLAERRLPQLYKPDAGAGMTGVKASFTFVLGQGARQPIDGESAEVVTVPSVDNPGE
jgi:hypothetical protein